MAGTGASFCQIPAFEIIEQNISQSVLVILSKCEESHRSKKDFWRFALLGGYPLDLV
jgi:hypothetical protein